MQTRETRDEPLSSLLNRLVHALNRSADTYIRQETDLTFSRFLLLETLRCTGETTQHRLAEALEVSDPVVSRMLTDLLRSGYVTVRPDPDHGRRKLVLLTDRGIQTTLQLGTTLEEAFMSIVQNEVQDISAFAADASRILAGLKKYGGIT